MKSAISSFLFAFLANTGVSAGYVQSFVDVHGGCQDGIGTLSLLEERLPSTDGWFLGKNAGDWTDEELEEYRRVLSACLRLHPGEMMSVFRAGEPIVAPPGAIEAKVDKRMDEVMRLSINPARAVRRQQEASLAAERALADDREIARANDERERARQQEAASDARLRQEQARGEQRRAALQAQAKRDRERANQERLMAEKEAPQIEATEKEASDAYRARVAAERHLEEVRQQVATAQSQLTADDAARIAVKAERLKIEQRDAQLKRERREDEALAKTCSVSADQFSHIALGMSLRDVRQTFGCVGSLNSSTEIQGVGEFSVYQWDGAKSGAAAITTFNDGKLVTKAQNALD